MQLSVIVAIVIAIAGVAFAMQNNAPAAVELFFWHFDASLGVIALLALALGALIVALVSTPATLRANWLVNRQRKEINVLQADNAGLRARAAELERQSASSRGGATSGLGREADPKA